MFKITPRYTQQSHRPVGKTSLSCSTAIALAKLGRGQLSLLIFCLTKHTLITHTGMNSMINFHLMHLAPFFNFRRLKKFDSLFSQPWWNQNKASHLATKNTSCKIHPQKVPFFGGFLHFWKIDLNDLKSPLRMGLKREKCGPGVGERTPKTGGTYGPKKAWLVYLISISCLGL